MAVGPLSSTTSATMLASVEQVTTPMRDGILLVADLFRPPSGRGPTLLLRTPYGRRNLPDILREVEVEPLLAARKGFAVMMQDLRGRNDSGGEFAPFVLDANDCADTVAWIRQQPWSDGRVATVGASYNGLVQFPGARARPQGLLAIAPTASGRGELVLRPGGALRLWLLTLWAMLPLTEALAGEIDAATRSEIEGLLAASPLERFAALYDDGSAMARFAGALRLWNLPPSDRYWTETVTPPVQPLPAVHTTGYYDVCAEGALAAYGDWSAVADPAAPQMLTLGPWDHMRAAPYADLGLSSLDIPPPIMAFSRQLAFISSVLRMPGADEPGAPVMSFVLGRNRWHEGDCWPPQGVSAVEMSLAVDVQGEGRLSLAATDEKHAIDYLYDPRDPVPTLGGAVSVWEIVGPLEQARVESRNDVLTFTSGRFDGELEIAGEPVASLLVGSSAPATDFIARLTLVQPDGRSLALVHGVWSGRLSDLSSSGEGRFRRCEIRLGPIHIVLAPGQRLRLQVTSSCYPEIYPNPNTGHDLTQGPPPSVQTAKQSLLVGASEASSLRLPVLGTLPRQAAE